jgi:hypothetical protein
MSEYPTRVDPVCAYEHFISSLIVNNDQRNFIRRLYPRLSDQSFDFDEIVMAQSPNFDGFLIVPVCGVDYAGWLKHITGVCGRALVEMKFVFTHDSVPGISDRWIRRSEYACIPMLGHPDHYAGVIQLQLGKRWAGYTPQHVCEYVRHLTPPGDPTTELLLDAGVGLLALTYLAHKGELVAPMRVDCPGTQFSVNGDGKFDDTLRWDVQPPTNHTPGVIELDWNWPKNRPRKTHGTATGAIAR